ncbi:MAG: signal peptidase II [Clostridia bacterium]|nr:signal peptidase II [Clostridia bacterium]
MKRYLWITPAVIILDQAAKWAARRMTEPIVLIDRVIGLRCTQNTGMAFSFLSDHIILLVLLSVVLMAAGYAVLRRYTLGTVSRTAAMLMLGGALSNMGDRLFLGYVTDMIELLFCSFAIFNVADICLTVGCGLMIFSLLFRPQEWRERHV